MKTQMIILFSVVVAICGCKGPELPTSRNGSIAEMSVQGEGVVSAITKIDNEDGKDAVVSETLSDENFSYTMGDEYSRSFKRLNPNATLNDLNDFAYAKCWNGYLRPKLQNAQKMTREDAVLLDFCINVQLNMVDTLAVAALGDMTEPGYLHNFVVKEAAKSHSHEKGMEGIYRDQNNVFVDLKANFLNSCDGIRVPMRQWANPFKSVPPEVMKRIFKDVETATGVVDNSGASNFGEHPWLWSSAYVGGLAVASLGGAGIVGIWHATAPDLPNTIEKGAMALNVPVVDMKNNWRNARNAMSTYLEEMRNMRQELKSIRSSSYLQDPKTRKYLQRVLSESDNDSTAVSQYLDYAMYDIPFCVMTYKANGQLKGCKGRFNDDEDKMMEVMSEYCQAVAGTEMLRHIRTRYAANGYVEAVTRLKDELSSSEWEKFLNESKLYKVEQKVDGTGRQQNELDPLKK